jgi:hypothetical protein
MVAKGDIEGQNTRELLFDGSCIDIWSSGFKRRDVRREMIKVGNKEETMVIEISRAM